MSKYYVPSRNSLKENDKLNIKQHTIYKQTHNKSIRKYIYYRKQYTTTKPNKLDHKPSGNINISNSTQNNQHMFTIYIYIYIYPLIAT